MSSCRVQELKELAVELLGVEVRKAIAPAQAMDAELLPADCGQEKTYRSPEADPKPLAQIHKEHCRHRATLLSLRPVELSSLYLHTRMFRK